jgi:hypothetical protein
MSHADKRKRILSLWKTTKNYLTSAVVMLRLKDLVTNKIALFGRQEVSKQLEDGSIKQQNTSRLVIMPNGRFMFVWNLLVILLLLYSCLYVPVEVAFLEFKQGSAGSYVDKTFNITIDVLFFVDIIVNFLQAYEIHDSSFEIRLGKIAKNYLFGWFFIDLVACIPVDLVEIVLLAFNDDANLEASRYAKLARIPRIYRIFRIVRIFKVFKVLKYNKTVQR